MPDNSKWEIKEENATPKEIFAKAFKMIGCKTLSEWSKLVKSSLISKVEGEEFEMPSPDEVLA